MTPRESDKITRARFERWAKLLKAQCATPFLTVAIGHGPSAGVIQVVVLEDTPIDSIELMLLEALHHLKPDVYRLPGESSQEQPGAAPPEGTSRE